MTRVTFGMYRVGVREPVTTLASYGAANSGTPIVTPISTARSAIARHHRESPATARAELHRSFRDSDYWGPKGRPSARGWAAAIRRCYDTYAQLTQSDSRPAFTTRMDRDINLPPDTLAVYIDVVLLDAGGYVPRLVLWDDNELTADRALAFGAPAWRAAEDELGDGRVAHVEVWSLRQPTQCIVTPAQANGAMPQVARVVHRLVS
jgi:hypothetical protein